MVTRERRVDRGHRQARRRLTTIGEELREARLNAGLTQRQVAAPAGISHTEVSRIERAAAPRVPFETLAVIGAVVGLDVSLRAYPDGDPIRDAAHIALLSRLRAMLPAEVTWRTEVPIDAPGDRRAWDAVIGGRGWRMPVEAETKLRDVQALSRRIALKARDDGATCLILLVADTRHNRRVLRLAAADLAAQFPLRGRAAVTALRRGEQPPGSGIVVL